MDAFQKFLESAPDSMLIVNREGSIVLVNSQTEKIFGYPREELIGRPIEILIPERFRNSHVAHRRDYTQSPRTRSMGMGLDLFGRRKDGREFPVEISLSPVDGEGVIAAVRDVTERKKIEEELRKNKETVLLHGEFMKATEQEQRRIGQELHDGLGQLLTGAALRAKALAEVLKEKNSEEAAEVSEIIRLVNESISEARRISRGLVPIALEKRTFSDALEELAYHAEASSGIRCAFEERGKVPALETDVTIHLYRIAQEALHNAIRHSGANHITIRLEGDGQGIILTVEDNGVGLPEEQKPNQGMGLTLMKYRARLIGGALEIMRQSTRGTVVTVWYRRHEDQIS